MAWSIVYYHADVQRAIMEFPPGIQARYIHLTERMNVFGPNLGMLHTRAMGKGLFELRLKSKEGIGRVFFGVLTDRTIIMLHALLKKTAKTPAREVHIARARWRERNKDADT